MAAIRYIHQNPVQAKMVRRIGDYKWSSYNDYILNYKGQSTNIDTDLIWSFFKTVDDFNDFMSKPNVDKFLDYVQKKKYSDLELKSVIDSIADVSRITDLTKKERNKIIFKIYKATGESIRQLSRVMGIGRGLVEKAVKR